MVTRYPLLPLSSIPGARHLLSHNHKDYVALMYSHKSHLEVLTSHKVPTEVLILSRNTMKMLLIRGYTGMMTIRRMYSVVLHRTIRVLMMDSGLLTRSHLMYLIPKINLLTTLCYKNWPLL